MWRGHKANDSAYSAAGGHELMRCVVILLLSAAAWGQAYTFPNVNNDTAVHSFTMPLPCPSTNAPDCAGPAGTNAALHGRNSIWAECDFSTSGGINNPECGGTGNQVVASNQTNAIANKNYVHIIRATDSTTGNNTDWTAGSDGGQMGENGIDATNTRMVFGSGSLFGVFSFDPNPSSPTYLQVQRLYGSFNIVSYTSYFSRQPPPYPGGRTVGWWYTTLLGSSIPGGVAGGLIGSHIYIVRFDFSSATTAPSYTSGNTGTIQVVKDLIVNGCLGASYVTSGMTRPLSNSMQVSYDDQYFNAAYEQSGCPAGTDCYKNTLVLYSVAANGCIVYRTDLGQVTNLAGTTSNIIESSSNQNFTTDTTGDGSPNFFQGPFMYIETAGAASNCGTNCPPIPCSPAPPCPISANVPRYVWETGIAYPANASPTGTRVWSMNTLPGCCSHRAAGFNKFVYYADTGVTLQPQSIANYDMSGRVLINSGVLPQITNCYTTNSSTVRPCAQEDHKTWSLNTDGTDTAPFLDVPYPAYNSVANSPTASSPLPYTGVAWSAELNLWPVTCALTSCSGSAASKPWRVVHTLNNHNIGTTNGDYSQMISSAAVSSHPSCFSGQCWIFISWTSNWQGQVGCQNGTYDTINAPSSGLMGLGCPSQGSRADVFIASVPVVVPATGSGYFYPWHN